MAFKEGGMASGFSLLQYQLFLPQVLDF